MACTPKSNRPRLANQSLNYNCIERKFAIFNDSTSYERESHRRFHLELYKDFNGYVAVWTDLIPTIILDTSSTEFQNIVDDNEFTDLLNTEFRLNPDGDIDSIINWSQVNEYIDSFQSIYLENNGTSSHDQTKIQSFLDSFNTQQHLMNTWYKGIGIYHNFYSIDANFTDTLVIQPYASYLKNDEKSSDARITISLPNAQLVDYLVTTESRGTTDTSFITELEKLSNNELDFSIFTNIRMVDSIYYRYNKPSMALESLFFNRYMEIDTMIFIQQIWIDRE